MIYLKYITMALGKLLLLPTVILVAPILSLFTREMPELYRYDWGGWYGTHDNPPQGDRGWVAKRSPFPNITSGVRGYINRVGWIIRNPLYGYNDMCSVTWESGDVREFKGEENVSDKNSIAGKLLTTLIDKKGKLKAFGLYIVHPYSKKKCIRIRLGWKVKSRKFFEGGKAQLVVTFNPIDNLGDKHDK